MELSRRTSWKARLPARMQSAPRFWARMKPFPQGQPRKPLNRINARNSALINQLATPGLGSLLAGRFVAGIGQLLLAVTGVAMVVVWFIKVMRQFYSLMDSSAVVEPRSVAWVALTGFGLFALAWLWALATSLSLLRQNRQDRAARLDPARPPPLDSA